MYDWHSCVSVIWLRVSAGNSEGWGSLGGFQSGLVVKNPPANAGDTRDSDLIAGWGRSPGGGNGNPLQYSCLENPMDRGAWWAKVHGITKSWTRLKWLSIHMGWLWKFQNVFIGYATPKENRCMWVWVHKCVCVCMHTRPPCLSPTPGVHPNSHPLGWWCHPAISSSVIHFSLCP